MDLHLLLQAQNTRLCLGLQSQSVAKNVKKQVKNGHHENKQESVLR
jgi:hypothetical protein